MPVPVRILMSLFLLGASWNASSAQTILGVSGYGAAVRGDLFSVDELSGEITTISDVTDSGLTGLGILSNRRVFATTIFGGGSESVLLELDPDTGARIQTIGPVTAGGTPISIGDLAVHPSTDVLYGIRSNPDRANAGGEIYTIAVNTGDATLIGVAEPAGVGGGLAFLPDGSLWRTSTRDSATGGSPIVLNELREISPTDASLIQIAQTGLSHFFDGLGPSSFGSLLATANNSGVFSEIYLLDPIGKTESLLSPGPSIGLSDLVFDSGLVPIRPTSWGKLKQTYTTH